MQLNPRKLVIKYNFSPLLNLAWSKTMTPSTICSEFRRCGVFPFNPNAIDRRLAAGKEDCEQHISSEEDNGDQDATHEPECEDHGFNKDNMSAEGDMYLPEESQIDRSADQTDSKMEQLYQRRFEEGYDIAIYMILGMWSG